MIALYLFFAVFFAVVLVALGIYEIRRADRLAEERLVQRFKQKEARRAINSPGQEVERDRNEVTPVSG